MNWLEAIALGAIQGLTEFLPVSSSGHLTVAQALFKLKETDPITMNLALHAATLIVVLLFFKNRIVTILKTRDVLYMRAILITCVPTAIIGIGVKKLEEELFTTTLWPSIFLCINGLWLLFITKKIVSSKADQDSGETPSVFQALVIGVAQGISALPGISRSGSTIGTARLLGINPEKATEYSLLASIPVISGAILLDLPKISHLSHPWMVLLGVLFSGLTGWLAIRWLLAIARSNTFFIWGFYCIFVGGALLFYTQVL